jgi:hypothetical protein
MAPATFTIAATHDTVRFITMKGDKQPGTVGKVLANPLEIVLKDNNNNFVTDALVAFVLAGGNGSVDAPPGGVVPYDIVTNSYHTKFTLGTKMSDPQLVAAFVPGQSKPLLFEATPKADTAAKTVSNKSNFSQMTLGTSRLNAIQIQVFDQYDNPVDGETIAYTAPAGLTVSPGLGPNGKFFTDFKTNKEGIHVAMVTISGAKPTIDEFGVKGDPNLAQTYSITATVQGTGLSEVYNVDVDMGPSMVTNSVQNDSALIGRPLANPVVKHLFRYERIDTFTDNDHNGKDDDNGDFRDENFTNIAQKGIGGIAINFTVVREDGKDESAFGLQPTRTGANAATTNGSGLASVGVTMGDVGGVSQVIGEINSIPVTWYYADGTVLNSIVFVDGNKFGESTNLVAIPVVITVELSDIGSGIDFSTLKAFLNGTAFFDATAPPAVLPTFPERLDVIVGGIALKTLNAGIINDSVFPSIKLNYYPSAPKLVTGSNSVQVNSINDKVGNGQSAPAVQAFTYP